VWFLVPENSTRHAIFYRFAADPAAVLRFVIAFSYFQLIFIRFNVFYGNLHRYALNGARSRALTLVV
jgi:hypothetical protein